jgi:hypothetical protein
VEDILARAELRVERDGGIVAMIGLHIDDPRAALGGDDLQVLDEGGGDAAAAMRLGDG